jgi:hypothetical protein
MTLNSLTCPLCNGENACGIKDASGCWCMAVDLPTQILGQIPAELNNVSCICQSCIKSFNQKKSVLVQESEQQH